MIDKKEQVIFIYNPLILKIIKENNRKLTQNYRKRVENFIINMIENPIPVVDYKGPL